MHRIGRTIPLAAIAVGLLIAGGPASEATDYCITVGGTSGIYVGKNFKLPPKNSCQTWPGFCSGCTTPNSQTGSACTDAKGSSVNFVLTTAYGTGSIQWDFVQLSLPSESGSGDFQYSSRIGSANSYSAQGATCDKKVP
jgi:hypothetical protein